MRYTFNSFIVLFGYYLAHDISSLEKCTQITKNLGLTDRDYYPFTYLTGSILCPIFVAL